VALLWKMICNLGDPMSLHHPVAISALSIRVLNQLHESDSYGDSFNTRIGTHVIFVLGLI